MKRLEGSHFYINISNLDEVVADEEQKLGKITHALHALDTFFSSIEAYGKKKYPNVFTVEKITGSRLHMYTETEIEEVFDPIEDISTYAYALSLYINSDISKYKTLMNFKIQIGCCYGEFYDFVFKTENHEEETTIGYAANYAAKLQNLTANGYISISENIYNALAPNQKQLFSRKVDSQINKYEQDCYYTSNVNSLTKCDEIPEELEKAKEIANNVNLNDMVFRSPMGKLSFDNISKKEGKTIQGIPLFADVRGFTSKFKEDDSNLEEMAKLTQSILLSMYNIVNDKGVHVQFQGDREFAVYNNYGDYDCCIDAVLDGMRIIDAIKNFGVCVGVGQSLGNMHVSRIGTRGEKDNVILGRTVTAANKYEDDYAEENQLVIGKEIYEVLRKKDSTLANKFSKLKQDCYYTTVGYAKYKEGIAQVQLNANNQKNNYNGAWRK